MDATAKVRFIMSSNTQELTFTQHTDKRGKPFFVPDALPELTPDQAMRTVVLPIHLDWSTPGKVRPMSDERHRREVYRIVLQEGGPEDIKQYVDGRLLVELWSDIYLPVMIHEAWQPLIDQIIAKT